MVKNVIPQFWNMVVERMQRKMERWKGKVLSNFGKLQLLPASLQGIPIYILFLYKISSKFKDIIEKIQQNLL